MANQHVVAPLTPAAIFLVATIDQGAERQIGELLTDVSGLTRSVGFRAPADGLNCVVGIGANLWDRLFGATTRPIHLRNFAEIRGERHTAPSTPGDLLFHTRANRMDLCFALAQLLATRLKGFGTIVDEVHGFKYFDERDVLGFVDGTENPESAAAIRAAVVGDEDPPYAGSSYVIIQKYLHNLEAWNALSVEDQERAIGRSKLDDVEMADDLKPANSHVALNTINESDGTPRQILRANMPFGRVGADEFGTFFIGYAADPGVTEQMLHNMFIGNPPGTTDRILDFSTPVTGALFFVPTVDFLDDPSPVARP